MPKVRALLDSFSPQAVLTVAHGYTWLTAARYAERAGLPLHLIVHDDWPRVAPARRMVERHFAGSIARRRRVCACRHSWPRSTSAATAPSGTVLLPARAPDARAFDGVATRLHGAHGGPVFAFAGTINSSGYVRLLQQLAEQLARHGGTLLIFGPLTPAQAAGAGLTAPNIRLAGLLPSGELLERLRADADVLFVPMSFAAEDRSNMRMSFPSKLTDYTAVGLPLLICGPADCSAVRWAQANDGVAEVVTSEDAAAMRAAVDRLCGDRESSPQACPHGTTGWRPRLFRGSRRGHSPCRPRGVIGCCSAACAPCPGRWPAT